MRTITNNELKQLQLEILKEIDTFCDNNNLCYYLVGGTLIGAIRHKGFIPWDDDVDIMMPRQDYEKLISSYNKTDNPKYQIVSIESTKGYYLPYAKMIHLDTVLYEKVSNPIPIGVFIDIFPMDSMPCNYEEACQFFDKVGKYRRILTLKNLAVSKNRSLFKNLIIILSHIILSIYPRHILLKKLDCVSRSFEKETNSSLICDVSVATYGYREILKREWLYPAKECDFEHLIVKVPNDYHRVLSHFFGDYMKLPPIEQQVSHHAFYAYWKD